MIAPQKIDYIERVRQKDKKGGQVTGTYVWGGTLFEQVDPPRPRRDMWGTAVNNEACLFRREARGKVAR